MELNYKKYQMIFLLPLIILAAAQQCPYCRWNACNQTIGSLCSCSDCYLGTLVNFQLDQDGLSSPVNIGICVLCPANCHSCQYAVMAPGMSTPIPAVNCTSCASGYTNSYFNGQCEPCPANCVTCSCVFNDCSRRDCTQCAPGYTVNATTGQCDPNTRLLLEGAGQEDSTSQQIAAGTWGMASILLAVALTGLVLALRRREASKLVLQEGSAAELFKSGQILEYITGSILLRYKIKANGVLFIQFEEPQLSMPMKQIGVYTQERYCFVCWELLFQATFLQPKSQRLGAYLYKYFFMIVLLSLVVLTFANPCPYCKWGSCSLTTGSLPNCSACYDIAARVPIKLPATSINSQVSPLGVCQLCPSNCKTCGYAVATLINGSLTPVINCTDCLSGFTTYNFTGQCRTCPDHCVICQFALLRISQTQVVPIINCTQCQPRYTYNYTIGTCFHCVDHCAECKCLRIDCGFVTCLTCDDGYVTNATADGWNRCVPVDQRRLLEEEKVGAVIDEKLSTSQGQWPQ